MSPKLGEWHTPTGPTLDSPNMPVVLGSPLVSSTPPFRVMLETLNRWESGTVDSNVRLQPRQLVLTESFYSIVNMIIVNLRFELRI